MDFHNGTPICERCQWPNASPRELIVLVDRRTGRDGLGGVAPVPFTLCEICYRIGQHLTPIADTHYFLCTYQSGDILYDREQAGKVVREAWNQFCTQTGYSAKTGPWEDLDALGQEVDKVIADSIIQWYALQLLNHILLNRVHGNGAV